LLHKIRRLVTASEVGSSHDFHEPHTTSVEVDECAVVGERVDALAAVVLEVEPLYAHRLFLIAVAQDHSPVHSQWHAVLRDLITRWHVGVKVVLTVKHRPAVHRAPQRQRCRHARFLR
jgi:hypothetical protein